jgi:CHAT domain-containing protein
VFAFVVTAQLYLSLAGNQGHVAPVLAGLASHWKVSDKATSQLMTEFMRRWRAGEPRAKGWREAQLSLLQSKEFASPYFWPAFTLTGQWR